MNKVRKSWEWLVAKLEHGDLIPLMILVSAGHYISVLREFDNPVTAAAVGLIVDLGHFRAVRIAAVYNYRKVPAGEKPVGRRNEFLLRWLVVAVLTVITTAYHLRFYHQDWALALPMPLLIAFLAYTEGRGPQGSRKVDEHVAQARAETKQARAALKETEQLIARLKEQLAQPVQLAEPTPALFEELCASSNGNLRSMTGKQLNRMAALGGLLPSSESTIKTWRDKYVTSTAQETPTTGK